MSKNILLRGALPFVINLNLFQAEFEAGPEEAEKRRQQAESEKKRMLEENEDPDDDDKYSDAYIKTRYRSVLKYGLSMTG